MHPCELENSALASLAKRLVDTEKRVLVEKTGTHLTNVRKRDEERGKRKTHSNSKRRERRVAKFINAFSTIVLTTYNY